YIFSMIKCFRERPEFVLPDRAQVTMTVPFMRAYTELLVRTCHRRGAHAMGGMAALIPSRRDPEANERALAAVRADQKREAGNGAAAINNLMEDAATAEIARSQIWQWKTHGRTSADHVRELAGDARGPAYELFEATALADELPEFLTLVALDTLNSATSA